MKVKIYLFRIKLQVSRDKLSRLCEIIKYQRKRTVACSYPDHRPVLYTPECPSVLLPSNIYDRTEHSS